MRQHFLIWVCLLILGVGSAETSRPNILFILADDLSWADLACYGNTVFETPNLDRLANEGMRFTQAYSPAPICSASRAGILTGKTPARLNFEFVTKNEPGFQRVEAPLRAPPFTLNLPVEEVTIPEALSAANYQTAFCGKWHINQHYKRYLGWSPSHGPKQQGFQKTIDDFGSHPYSYWRNKKARVLLDIPEGEFPKDSLTHKAIDFLLEERDAPFFCMVSHFYVHDPVHTKMRWLRDQYLEKLPEDQPRREVIAEYGAMVTSLDHYVGELIMALEESGQIDSTLIVFTSDNGGHPNYAGNAPLRGSKWNLYEGGIRVPMIAKWPGKVAAGSVCETPVTSLDLFATFAELGGVGYPSAEDSHSILPLLKGGAESVEPRSLFWHFPYYHPERGFDQSPEKIGVNDGVTSQTRPHSAIRKGDNKLIWFHEDDRAELYQIDSETVELSEKQPALKAELLAELKSYLEIAGARMPTPNPSFKSGE